MSRYHGGSNSKSRYHLSLCHRSISRSGSRSPGHSRCSYKPDKAKESEHEDTHSPTPSSSTPRKGKTSDFYHDFFYVPQSKLIQYKRNMAFDRYLDIIMTSIYLLPCMSNIMALQYWLRIYDVN
jgi:hypothetical protein